MNRTMKIHNGKILALICCGLLASGSVIADKASWMGSDNDYGNGSNRDNSENRKNDRQNNHRVNDDDRRHDSDDYRVDRARHNDDRDHDSRNRSHSSRYFDTYQRNRIHDYYSSQRHSRRCPPGLAKRNNGCMPYGQEKKWAVGKRLPHDVIFHNLEPRVLAYLGPPPSRHRFVRVASDILLITLGTGMVIDAIDDLGRDW